MPAPTKKDPDAYECWPVKKPVMYTVRAVAAAAAADDDDDDDDAVLLQAGMAAALHLSANRSLQHP